MDFKIWKYVLRSESAAPTVTVTSCDQIKPMKLLANHTSNRIVPSLVLIIAIVSQLANYVIRSEIFATEMMEKQNIRGNIYHYDFQSIYALVILYMCRTHDTWGNTHPCSTGMNRLLRLMFRPLVLQCHGTQQVSII